MTTAFVFHVRAPISDCLFAAQRTVNPERILRAIGLSGLLGEPSYRRPQAREHPVELDGNCNSLRELCANQCAGALWDSSAYDSVHAKAY